MIRRPAGALAGIAMILLLAAPAEAQLPPAPPGVFDVPRPVVPVRDVVLTGPDVASARISATANTAGYPIGDGSGATVAVGVTAACRATCTAADPQAIAAFIGTLPHGREVSLLTVQLNTEWQIAYECGYGAQACYDLWHNRIIISGDDALQADGASREFILAHEYGHHLAGHRPAPPPFTPAIDWGPPRWASYENVCQGFQRHHLFPGNQGRGYYRNPGEAFAEAFAYSRFPDSPVPWGWTPTLMPDAGAFAAIRRDVRRPWARRSFTIRGRLPEGGRRAVERIFRTPLDGRAIFRFHGPGASQLSVRDRGGPKRRDASGGRPLKVTVCDQRSLRAVVKRRGSKGGSFTLSVERP
jgi:hypothetical protein